MRLRLPAIALLTFVAAITFGQEEFEVSEATKRYLAAREKWTEPSYGLAKVKSLIKGLKRDVDENRILKKSLYDKLTFGEKFTFTCLHAEEYSQNCDAMPPIKDEEKLILSHFPDAFSEAMWSQRQVSFLTDNRDRVIQLLRETINKKREIGLNLKRVIYQISAIELVPDILRNLSWNPWDMDCYSLITGMLNERAYAPFKSSAMGKEMYGEESNYRTWISATPQAKATIVSFAKSYYHQFGG